MTKKNKRLLKNSFINSLVAVAVFLVYYTYRDIGIVREYFGDFGYDYTIQGFAKFNSNIGKTNQKIIIIKVDERYLKENNLSDDDGGIRYNYTPRFVIANILKDLDNTIKENHPQDPHYPKALFIDYMFTYPGDIDGAITEDDQKLIDSIDHYANLYDIYLPTLPNGIFLEKQKLHKNIHFVSANGIVDSDEIQRGYKPYMCQGAKAVPNLSIAVSSDDISASDDFACPMAKDTDYNNYFKYRILYKDMDSRYLSNWDNMAVYSASDLDTSKGLIGEDFKDSIVLIGSDYQHSGDLHPTPAGVLSGVFVMANAVATRYYADGYIETLDPWWSIAIYFVLFMSVSFYMPRLLDKVGLKNEALQYLIILTFMAFIFYVLSILLLVYTQTWLNWVIPWAIFQFMDGKTLLKEMWHKLLVWIRAINMRYE